MTRSSHFEQLASANQFDLLGGRGTGSPKQSVPVNDIGIEQMDAANRRFGHRVEHVRTSAAEAEDGNPLTADAVLNRAKFCSIFEGVRYVERVEILVRSRWGFTCRGGGPDDLFCIAVDHVVR